MVMLLIAGLLTADVAETQSPTSKSYWGERTLNGIVQTWPVVALVVFRGAGRRAGQEVSRSSAPPGAIRANTRSSSGPPTGDPYPKTTRFVSSRGRPTDVVICYDNAVAWLEGNRMLTKTLAIRTTDINDGALRHNGMGTIVVRPDDVRDETGGVIAAYAVTADFFPVGVDQRRFRTLADAMAFVCSLVLTADETAQRLQIIPPTVEIHLLLRGRA